MPVSLSERGARSNPLVESLWGRMKTETGSRIHQAPDLHHALDLREIRTVIAGHFRYYNQCRRHSMIENVPPLDRLTEPLHQSNPESSMTAAA